MSLHNGIIDKEDFLNVTDKLTTDNYRGNKGRELVDHQIGSFEDFISNKLEQTIKGFNPIQIASGYMPELSETLGVPQYQYYIDIMLDNPQMSKPMIDERDGSTKVMTPMDARNRKLTYSSPLTVDLHVQTKTHDHETNTYISENKRINNVLLGKIPIMVGSKYCITSIHENNTDECPFDFGGYFIINGNEKVLVSHDRIEEGKTFVYPCKDSPTYKYIGEIRSVKENTYSVPKTTSVKMSSKPNQHGHYIRVNIHHIKQDIPVFILFRAFGFESDRDIINLIVYDIDDPENADIVRALIGSVEDANNVLYTREAMEYLMKYLNISGYPKEFMGNHVKRMEILSNVLHTECLPHVGEELYKKALYLGYMVNKLIKCSLGKLPLDDRDSYINKRVDTAGTLIASLFRQNLGKLIKDLRNGIQKEIKSNVNKQNSKIINVINPVTMFRLIKPRTIECGLKYSFSTGNWGTKSNKTKQGVAQVRSTLTYNASISHARRIVTPIDRKAKLMLPRKLHGTQIGVICPAETPEGISVGLVKNMSILAKITCASNSTHLRQLMKDTGIDYFTGQNIEIFKHNATKVFVNGDLIGTHKHPEYLYRQLKTYKRAGIINVFTGIVWLIASSELWICTEGGRCTRPMYVVENNATRFTQSLICDVMHGRKTWKDLVARFTVNDNDNIEEHSVIEYMDVQELNTAMVAMTLDDLTNGSNGNVCQIQYTHLEISPSLMMGVMAGCIPFSNHNQAPRNCYQSSMAKQAIGIYATNYRKRYDTIGHILNYGHYPLVQTKPSKLINGDKLPCGVNVIVAIACYTGFNQEDSLILNKSAVDRGLFHSTYYKTYKEHNNKNHSTGEEEFCCKPNPKTTIKLKPYNYNKINADGYVPLNTYVEAGDVLIGKCMPQRQGTATVYKDNSYVLRNNEQGFVEKNFAHDRRFTNVNGDGYKIDQIMLRNWRIPTTGDKFSSRMGQKGTIGVLYRQEDMPFTKEGIVPDVIINPHAIPSRMTIGQLLEGIMGKACASLGAIGDGTPFTNVSVEDIAQALEDNGMERYGDEIMYDSRTGKQIPTSIFMSPVYYQKLKHMTNDKVHSRASNGPVVMLTRQPSEGRARDGGLRLGEMEVDCLWSHGVMQFLKERFMECSDNYRFYTCKKCGTIAIVNPEDNKYLCKRCKNTTKFSEVRVPYAFKLLLQEIQTMGIGARFITK